MVLRLASTRAAVFVFGAVLTSCGNGSATPAVAQPGPAPVAVLGELDAKARVGLWANAGNVIFGQNSKGNQTVAAVNVAKNGCAGGAEGIKVDRSNNLRSRPNYPRASWFPTLCTSAIAAPS
jgi:hypothetical protein